MSETLYRWIRESDRPKGQEDVTHAEAGSFRKVSWCQTHLSLAASDGDGCTFRRISGASGRCYFVAVWMEVL